MTHTRASHTRAQRAQHKRAQQAKQRRLCKERARLLREQTRAQHALQALEQAIADLGLPTTLAAEIQWRSQAQIERFEAALGRRLTHIDSHHNVHRDPRLTPLFIALAQRYGLPLREHSAVRYFASFYGQWGGETHPEQISVEKLLTMLASEVGEGMTELSCHPGYRGPDFESVYHAERELELRTLSDPRIPAFLKQHQIRLISFRELATGGFPLHTPLVRVFDVAQGEHADPWYGKSQQSR